MAFFLFERGPLSPFLFPFCPLYPVFFRARPTLLFFLLPPFSSSVASRYFESVEGERRKEGNAAWREGGGALFGIYGDMRAVGVLAVGIFTLQNIRFVNVSVVCMKFFDCAAARRQRAGSMGQSRGRGE